MIKGRGLPRPMIETVDEFMTCGWGATMEEATICAMRDMVDFVEGKLAHAREPRRTTWSAWSATCVPATPSASPARSAT